MSACRRTEKICTRRGGALPPRLPSAREPPPNHWSGLWARVRASAASVWHAVSVPPFTPHPRSKLGIGGGSRRDVQQSERGGGAPRTCGTHTWIELESSCFFRIPTSENSFSVNDLHRFLDLGCGARCHRSTGPQMGQGEPDVGPAATTCRRRGGAVRPHV